MESGKLFILISIVLALAGLLFGAALLAAGTVLAKPLHSIAGSSVTTGGGYAPGSPVLFCATAHNASTDLEWLDAVTVTFPSGWTALCDWQAVQDSCGNPVAFDCIAAANSISYLDNDAGFGEVYGGCSWSFCLTLNASGDASGSQSVAWALSGDDFGVPPHDVNGAETIYEGGWLGGFVLDFETGDADPTCTQATVSIEPGGLNVPVEPATGHYGPIALATGTYDVVASAPGYSVEGPTQVDVTSGITTTQDFHLSRPVIELAPTDFVSATAIISKEVIYGLTIGNAGHRPLEFEISEGTSDLPWVWEDPISATVPAAGEVQLDVTFHCTEPHDYVGGLQIVHNAPCQEAPIEVPIELHCAPDWRKWANSEEWTPEIEVTVEISDVIEIQDVVSTTVAFELNEFWNPNHLALVDYEIIGGNVITGPDLLEWSAEAPSGPMTLTKWFHVEPSTWSETAVHEELAAGSLSFVRPVPIIKAPPLLWIDGPDTTEVGAGEIVTLTLLYGNAGGYENDVMLRNEFPPEAPFLGSVPPASREGPEGEWAEWDVGDLATNDGGGIEVAVATSEELPPCVRMRILAWIHNHLGEALDTVFVDLLHVPCHQSYVPLTLKNY